MSTLVTRAGKGSPLTHNEVDANFNNLNSDKAEKANNLSDLTNTATARTNLGVAIGTNVQAYDADLAAIAALSPTADNFIVGNGTAWILETPSQARTSLGLGTIATQAAPSGTVVGTSDSQTLSNKSIVATQLTGTIEKARLPAGSVLQVVQALTSSLGTSTSTSYADTGLSATITPISTSNKILVIVSQTLDAVGGDAVGYGYQVNAGIQLLRQSTLLVTTGNDTGGKYTFSFGTGAAPITGNISYSTIATLTYLDSPATTSPQTYKTQYAKGTSGMSTIFVNTTNSFITLMEIAG